MNWEQLAQIFWEAPLPLLATCVFCTACTVAAFVLAGKEIKLKEKKQ